MNTRSMQFDYWVLISSLTLARAPLLLDDGIWKTGFSIISIIPMWVVIFKNLFFRTFGIRLLKPLKNGLFWPFLLLLILVLIAFIRGQIYGALLDGFILRHIVWWVTILLFGVALFMVPLRKRDVVRLRQGIYFCLGVYVVFNVLLQLAGVELQRQVLVWDSFGKATILSFMGIDATRVAFATASGPGPFGVVAGAVVLIGATVLFDRKRFVSIRLVGLLMLISGLYALLLSDTRSTILWVVLAPVVIFIFRRKLKPLLPYIPVGYLLFPGMLMLMAILLSATPIGDKIGRSDKSDNVATLSNRAHIWGAALDEINEFKSIHLIGYGIHGQVTSGVGSKIAIIAKKNFTNNVEHKTAHSFVLQSILDVGYLGLFVIILFMIRLFKVVSKMGIGENRRTHEVFLVFVVLAGTTEVVPTIYTNEITTVMILLAISLLRQDNHAKNYRSPILLVPPEG